MASNSRNIPAGFGNQVHEGVSNLPYSTTVIHSPELKTCLMRRRLRLFWGMLHYTLHQLPPCHCTTSNFPTLPERCPEKAVVPLLLLRLRSGGQTWTSAGSVRVCQGLSNSVSESSSPREARQRRHHQRLDLLRTSTLYTQDRCSPSFTLC